MSNRLANEISPYLLQHADNPVDWYTWGEEALKLAREQNKPIILSIGYSACHWCHVMAHESFADQETADIMNQNFINIKVDREERPDLDKIYQTLHQILMGQGGGWPLTVFLTPKTLLPFFSGTYFPLQRRYGRPSFKEVLMIVWDYYQKNSEAIQKSNAALENVIEQMAQKSLVGHKIKKSPLLKARERWIINFDEQNGGLKGAPKFPMPTLLQGMLYGRDEKLTQQVIFTLEKIARGGLYDHLGGGFFRYSVDDIWEIPHFEKMLYDNAQLVGLIAVAYGLSGKTLFKEIIGQTISFLNDLKHGGYYSSVDADSEGEEGKFYIWTDDEVKSLLDPETYPRFARHFGLIEKPNFEGKWHLVEKESLGSLAMFDKKEEERIKGLIDDACKTLFKSRDKRIKPAVDDKILCSWNALMLKGLSLAAWVTDSPIYSQHAESLFHFLKNHLYRDGELWVAYKKGKLRQAGFLDDYAFLLDALWFYLQIKWDKEAFIFAKALADKLISDFWDENKGCFYFTSTDHEKVVYRPQSWMDEVIPSGSAVAAVALQRFGYLLNNATYTDVAHKALQSAHEILDDNPQAFPTLLVAQSDYLSPPPIVILYGEWDPVLKAKAVLRKNFQINRSVFAISHAQGLPKELAQYQSADDLTAYICEGTHCLEPVKSVGDLEKFLRSS